LVISLVIQSCKQFIAKLLENLAEDEIFIITDYKMRIL